MDELESLKAQEAELRAKLAELEKLKAEALHRRRMSEQERVRQEELKKEINILVKSLIGGNVYIYCESRWDVEALIREYRVGYRNIYETTIPLGRWNEFLEKVSKLPNLNVGWESKDIMAKIQWALSAPPWEIFTDEKEERNLFAKPGPNTYRYTLDRIPGAWWSEKEELYRIPLNESWRIPATLEGIEGIVYSQGAQEAIFGQLEKRDELNQICLKEDSEVLKEGLNGHMFKPYQRVGVEVGLATGGNLVISDDTGLGKTWEGIGISEMLKRSSQPERQKKWQTLIICKATNLPNWREEVKKLTGIQPTVVKGGFPTAHLFKEIVMERSPWVIISYDTFGSKQYLNKKHDPEDDTGFYAWSQTFESSLPDVLLMDEAHSIKNTDTHRWKAIRVLAGKVPHVIPMTASIIKNRTPEMWPVLHMVKPQQFPSLEGFTNRYTHDGIRPKNTEQLFEMLRPIFLRRKKKDVMRDLPDKNRILQFYDLSPEGQSSYQSVLQGVYRVLKTFDPQGIGGAEMGITQFIAEITRLKQVCADDSVGFTADLATDLADEDDENRILIFSGFKGPAAAIAQRLGGEAVCTVKRTEDDFVSMNPEQRHELFENARKDPRIKYIVTTSGAKEGHNIEYCNKVIFNDLWWTPEDHRQAEDRAYGRISNPHPIDAHYVIADTAIVRWIQELLNLKSEVIDEVVEGVEASRKATSTSVARQLMDKIRQEMWKKA